MTPRQYDLYLTGMQKLAFVLPVILFTLVPIIFFVVIMYGDFVPKRGGELPPFFPLFPFALFFLFAIYFLSFLLSLPYRITVGHDKLITFKSVLKARVVRPTDIVSIEPKSIRMNLGICGFQVKYLNGKILYPGQFTGMYLLLSEIKQANPSVEIKGC